MQPLLLAPTPPSHARRHLDVLVIVPQRRQAVLVRVPKVAQQQVDVGAVGAQDGVERGVAAPHLQATEGVGFLLWPGAECVSMKQPRMLLHQSANPK